MPACLRRRISLLQKAEILRGVQFFDTIQTSKVRNLIGGTVPPALASGIHAASISASNGTARGLTVCGELPACIQKGESPSPAALHSCISRLQNFRARQRGRTAIFGCKPRHFSVSPLPQGISGGCKNGCRTDAERMPDAD